MREKTKLICLILFNTIVTLIMFFFEFIDGSPEESDWQDLVVFGIAVVGFIVFGLITESFKNLLIYSFFSAVVHIIFLSTGMYYNPDYHSTLPPEFGNSIALFGVFVFAFVGVIAFFSIGAGMGLSNLFRKIFRQ